MAISRGKPRQGVVGLAAVSLRGSDEVQELARNRLFPPGSPRAVDRGGYRHGGWG